MKTKILMISALGLLLSACADNPDVINDRAQKNFKNTLPEGCTINYLGVLNRGSHVNGIPMVAVICDGRKTTTTTILYSSGKYTYPAMTAHISEEL